MNVSYVLLSSKASPTIFVAIILCRTLSSPRIECSGIHIHDEQRKKLMSLSPELLTLEQTICGKRVPCLHSIMSNKTINFQHNWPFMPSLIASSVGFRKPLLLYSLSRSPFTGFLSFPWPPDIEVPQGLYLFSPQLVLYSLSFHLFSWLKLLLNSLVYVSTQSPSLSSWIMYPIVYLLGLNIWWSYEAQFVLNQI